MEHAGRALHSGFGDRPGPSIVRLAKTDRGSLNLTSTCAVILVAVETGVSRPVATHLL